MGFIIAYFELFWDKVSPSILDWPRIHSATQSVFELVEILMPSPPKYRYHRLIAPGIPLEDNFLICFVFLDEDFPV